MWLPHRKIQVDIVTIFLILMSAYSLITLTYIRLENYKSVQRLAEIIVENISKTVSETINGITAQIELVSKITRGVIQDLPTNHEQMISFLLNIAKYDQLACNVIIATKDGNYLSVFDLTAAKLDHYYSEPSKPLPEGAKLALRTIYRSQESQAETWRYYDTNQKVIGEETVQAVSYDHRADSWFTEVEKWPKTRWANSFLPNGMKKGPITQEQGLTIFTPLYDATGDFSGVIAIDMSLNLFSNFITHLKKNGITGEAFIIDDQGQILIPTKKNLDPNVFKWEHTLVQPAYQQFIKTGKQNYHLTSEQIPYLLTICRFPLSFDTQWNIAVLVPFNDFFGPLIKTLNKTILISIFVLCFFAWLVYLSSKYISHPIIQLAKEVDKIEQFEFDGPIATDSSIKEIRRLTTSIKNMREAIHSFSRYVPKEIVKKLVQQGYQITLSGGRRNLTIMFSDIENFTAPSERVPIEILNQFLADYFDQLSITVLKQEGTIDKYIGDSIMSFWGAPQDAENKEIKACLTALQSKAICSSHGAESISWKTRFGIHSGEVIVGNIGTSERMNYTAIGDAVNTAARIEQLNKIYRTTILISETIEKKIRNSFITRPIDRVAVKGKKNEISVFELLEAEQKELADLFLNAYTLFNQKKLTEAKAAFEMIRHKFPDDYPTQMYLSRLEALKKT